ncbi:hypothetical protein BKA70DRAFT_1446835 [Coprinopsis sp. MPI-PUGE-AT-0042]|nr:hypothetical protein BKA70DRAFT_1446835 [Coprinopsis sp. MPI-PUGE-AT-0042]
MSSSAGDTQVQPIARHRINDLPIEVLLIIFRNAFYLQAAPNWRLAWSLGNLFRHDADDPLPRECRGPGCFCRFSPDLWNEIKDPGSLDLFPYNLCRVSPHWDKATAHEPEFWTRLVVLLDTKSYDPLARLQIELDRSRGLPTALYLVVLKEESYAFELESSMLEKLQNILSGTGEKIYATHIHGLTNRQAAQILCVLGDCETARLDCLTLASRSAYTSSSPSFAINVLPSLDHFVSCI